PSAISSLAKSSNSAELMSSKMSPIDKLIVIYLPIVPPYVCEQRNTGSVPRQVPVIRGLPNRYRELHLLSRRIWRLPNGGHQFRPHRAGLLHTVFRHTNNNCVVYGRPEPIQPLRVVLIHPS